MAADDWIWKVDKRTTGAMKKNPLEVEFDEGVRQIAPRGLKAGNVTYRVISILEDAELQAAYDFLDARDGMPFLWTPNKAPITTQKQWTCNDYDWFYEGGLICGINATFRIFRSP